jgi:hypothetical protein
MSHSHVGGRPSRLAAPPGDFGVVPAALSFLAMAVNFTDIQLTGRTGGHSTFGKSGKGILCIVLCYILSF